MFRLIRQNIRCFRQEKPGIFVLYTVSLTAIAFLSLFLLNTVTQTVFNGDYMTSCIVRLKDTADIDVFSSLMKKNGLNPDMILYLNETSAKYNNIEELPIVDSETMIYLMSRALKDDEPVGVAAYVDNRIYSMPTSFLQSGRFSESSDAHKSCAIISEKLYGRLENDGSSISADGTEYSVIGTSNSLNSVSNNSIFTDPGTFKDKGYRVKTVWMSFSLPPSAAAVKGFSNAIAGETETENLSKLKTFNYSVLLSMASSYFIYLVVMAVIIISMTTLFGCWMSSQNYVYTVYSICGLGKSKALCMRLIEMLIYIIPSAAMGTLLYYALLAAGYKRDVYYPLPVLLLINLLLMIAICSLMFINHRERTKSGGLYSRL